MPKIFDKSDADAIFLLDGLVVRVGKRGDAFQVDHWEHEEGTSLQIYRCGAAALLELAKADKVKLPKALQDRLEVLGVVQGLEALDKPRPVIILDQEPTGPASYSIPFKNTTPGMKMVASVKDEDKESVMGDFIQQWLTKTEREP